MNTNTPASIATTLRRGLARIEAGFDQLVRIRFSAPWRGR